MFGWSFDHGAVSGVLVSQLPESLVLEVLVHVHETVDCLDCLLGLFHVDVRVHDAALGHLLAARVLVVALLNNENSAEVLLGLHALGTDAHGRGGLRCAVESGVVQRTVTPLVAVELDEVCVVLLG